MIDLVNLREILYKNLESASDIQHIEKMLSVLYHFPPIWHLSATESPYFSPKYIEKKNLHPLSRMIFATKIFSHLSMKNMSASSHSSSEEDNLAEIYTEFSMLKTGTGEHRATYAFMEIGGFLKQRGMLPGSGLGKQSLSLYLVSHEKKDHIMLSIIMDKDRFIFDPTLDPEKIFSKTFYEEELLQYYPDRGPSSPASYEIELTDQLYTEVMEKTQKKEEEIFNRLTGKNPFYDILENVQWEKTYADLSFGYNGIISSSDVLKGKMKDYIDEIVKQNSHLSVTTTLSVHQAFFKKTKEESPSIDTVIKEMLKQKSTNQLRDRLKKYPELINLHSSKGAPLIFYGISELRLDIVECILSFNPDLNLTNMKGLTPYEYIDSLFKVKNFQNEATTQRLNTIKSKIGEKLAEKRSGKIF